MGSFGALVRVGVEGTGSYGAGLARCLAAAGVEVVEVNRPNRQTRRRRDKTDTVDAGAAARAALCGDATAEPKSGDGCAEAIRMLGVARRCAVKARTQAANQISGLIVTAPEHLKDRLKGLNTNASVEVCARWRPESSPDSVTAVAKTALRSLAQRHQALTDEYGGGIRRISCQWRERTTIIDTFPCDLYDIRNAEGYTWLSGELNGSDAAKRSPLALPFLSFKYAYDDGDTETDLQAKYIVFKGGDGDGRRTPPVDATGRP